MRKRFSILEERAINILEHHKVYNFVREFRFHPIRKWKFDIALPDKKIAVELEGGIWTGGAHTRGVHYTSDCEKYNQATILGWRILRYTESNIYSIPIDLQALGVL